MKRNCKFCISKLLGQYLLLEKPYITLKRCSDAPLVGKAGTIFQGGCANFLPLCREEWKPGPQIFKGRENNIETSGWATRTWYSRIDMQVHRKFPPLRWRARLPSVNILWPRETQTYSRRRREGNQPDKTENRTFKNILRDNQLTIQISRKET